MRLCKSDERDDGNACGDVVYEAFVPGPSVTARDAVALRYLLTACFSAGVKATMALFSSCLETLLGPLERKNI